METFIHQLIDNLKEDKRQVKLLGSRRLLDGTHIIRVEEKGKSTSKRFHCFVGSGELLESYSEITSCDRKRLAMRAKRKAKREK